MLMLRVYTRDFFKRLIANNQPLRKANMRVTMGGVICR